jgi:hypothetical protein
MAMALAMPIFSRSAGGRTQQAPPLQDTGAIAGTLVTEGQTRAPVRRAVLSLTEAGGGSAQVTFSDDDGRFVFSGLAAGTFSLSAMKTGLLRAFYGSKRPGRGPGIRIALAAGERVSIAMTMARGAVITGAITDTRGRPVPDLQVFALSPGRVSQTASLALPAGTAVTDDRGVYRIFGLAPGSYFVTAAPPIRVGDALMIGDAEVQWARQQLAAGAAVIAEPRPTWRRAAYAPIFYPGTPDAGNATTLSVSQGEERTNASFTLQLVATSRVSGVVLDQGGQPAQNPILTLTRTRDDRSAGDLLSRAGLIVPPRPVIDGGRFVFDGIQPGAYTLMARTGGPAGRGGGPISGSILWAEANLTLTGQDQTDLVLTLQPGMTVAGALAFDAAQLKPPADPSTTAIALVPRVPLGGAVPSRSATVLPSGAFTITDVMPGAYTVRVTPPGGAAATAPRWQLASVAAGGQDAADVPLEVKPGASVNGVVVTLTDRDTEISGSLLNADGRLTADYVIVVFTSNRSLWLPAARRIRYVRPATNGRFSIASLPPGEYRIAGVSDLDPDDLEDPAYLAQLEPLSLTITLLAGERRTQNLQVGKAGSRP